MSCGFEQLQDWYRTLTALGVKKIKNPISGGNKKQVISLSLNFSKNLDSKNFCYFVARLQK